MVELYVELVKAGKRTLASVPEKYRSEVEARIEEGVE